VFAALQPIPVPHAPVTPSGLYQTDLFTGSASYSYPIKIPKGTNDLTPDVSLSYNSGAARDIVQRFGSGWQLNQDYIERDVNFTPSVTSDDKFVLHFKGAVYELVYVSAEGRYHTKVESNLFITKIGSGGTNSMGEYWIVRTEDGTRYRFGYHSDSELVCDGHDWVRLWNVDEVEDTHLNHIYYTYNESSGVSYLSKIEYNNDKARAIDFGYETASFQHSVRIQGCVTRESNRLSSIQIKANSNLVHQFDLGYTQASSSAQLLQSITERGTTGTASALPATTFEYKPEIKSISPTYETWINNAPVDVHLEKTDVVQVDVNGDGLVDIVKSEGSGTNTWKVWKNTGSGWNTTYETWVNNQPIDAKLDRSDTKLMDVTGDGLPDIVKGDNADNWRIWRNTGKSWSTRVEKWADVHSISNDINLNSSSVTLADVTGDGRADIIRTWWNAHTEWQVFRSTGSSWNTTPEIWSNNGSPDGLDATDVSLVDVNGDGLADIVRTTHSGTNATWTVYKNTGDSWETSPETWINNANVDVWLEKIDATLADINGDGLVDIVKSDDSGSTDKWKVLLNKGDSWSTTWETWIDPSQNVDLSLQGNTQMVDVTGDGLPDVIRTTDDGGGYDTWKVWRNNGNAPFLLAAVNTSQGGKISFNYTPSAEQNTDNAPTDSYTAQYYNNQTLSGSPTLTRTDSSINFDWGNGSPDGSISSDNFSARWTQIAQFSEGGYTFTATSDDGVRLYVDGELILDKWFDHGPALYSVTKALTEGSHTIVYEYYENTGGAMAELSYTKTKIPFNLWLVTSMTMNNGMSGVLGTSDVTTYSYKNGFYDWLSRELRGFAEVKETLPNAAKRNSVFYQDDARKGRPASIQDTDNAGLPYAKIEDTWNVATPSGIFTVNLADEKQYTYDGATASAKIKETGYQYDSYGNVTKISELGDTSLSGDERFTYNEYTASPSAWLVNTLKHTYENDATDSAKMSESWLYYDQHSGNSDAPHFGDVTKEVKWLSGASNPETNYTYDSYGNVASVTDPNNHTTTYTYGINDATHTYAERETNAKSQQTNYSYDLGTGNLLSKTDPNGLTTSYEYDVFGRLKKEIKPYDNTTYASVSYQYSVDGIAPEGTLVSVREASASAGTVDTYSYIDGLGRKVQTRGDAEDSAKQNVVDTYYDPTGQVLKQTVPYVASNSATFATPSAGIRNTAMTYDPIGRVSIVTNPKGDSRTTAYFHWKVTNIDEKGAIKRNFLNAFDKITKVEEVLGATSSATIYTYNTRDDLTQITDAKGNNFGFSYDTLGRKTSQADPDMGTWHYGYDAIGNLTSTTDARGISTTRSYDELNRVTGVNYPTDTDISYAYDLGKIGTLSIATDSAGTVAYTYDNRLRKNQEQRTISGTTKTTQFAYDSADRLTTQTNPDSTAASYTFNNQGEIESLTGVVDNFDYNTLGKITKKDFNNGVSTNYTYNTDDFRLNRIQTGSLFDKNYTYDAVGNVASITDNLLSKTQTFSYDDLDRLKTASESAGFNYSYEYNPIGNLTKFTSSGIDTTYTYGSGSALPHALIASSTTATGSAETELLSGNWNLAGSNGDDQTDEGIASDTLHGKQSVKVTFDLHGTSFGSGDDEASVIFIQGGEWMAANVVLHGNNGQSGSQTVDIPLSAFHKVNDSGTVLNPEGSVSNLHARFWNSGSFNVDITSIKVVGAGSMSTSQTVSVTNLTTGTDTDGNSSASTASVSPSANKLELLTVSSMTNISADPNQPTISGNGLTWVAVSSTIYDTTSSSRRRVTLFRASGQGPTTGALSISFGGQNQTDVAWVLDEATNVDSSGTTVLANYSESNVSTNDVAQDAGNPGAGQVFTPSQTTTLDSAKFYLSKVGSPTGNGVAKIYAISGTPGTNAIPTGSALATSDSFNVASLTGSNQMITFNFSGTNRITLTSGTWYAVTFEYTNGNGSNYVSIGADNTSPTHAGNEFYYDSGWGADNTWDEIFSVSGGKGGIVQVATNKNPTDTGVTSLTVTLGSFASSGNATYGVFGNGGEGSLTAGSGFSVVAQNGTAGVRAGTEFRSDTDTSVDMTTPTAFIGGIALELKAATATASGATNYLYDANGNMTADGINLYEYNEANQLKRVKLASNSATLADYVYDYKGQRIIKKNYSGGSLANTVTSWTPSYETMAIVGGSTETTVYYYANGELVARKNPAAERVV